MHGQRDIAWLVGLVVSGVVYLLLSRSLDLTPERTAEQTSNTELGHGAHAGAWFPRAPRSRYYPAA